MTGSIQQPPSPTKAATFAASPVSPRARPQSPAASPRKQQAQQPGSKSGSVYKSSPRWSLKAGGRFSPRQRGPSPDPGTYHAATPEATSKMPLSPRFGFGSSATGRLNPAKQTTPGPGAYAHQEYLGDQGKCSWLFSDAADQSQGSPAGGDEELSTELAGRSPKKPGSVGGGTPSSKLCPQSSPRKSLKSGSSVTGSGSKQVGASPPSKSPGYTMSPRREASPPKVPGPGQYEHQRVASPGVLWRFGRSPARPRNEAEKSPTHDVGPGAYNLPNTVGSAPAFSFMSRRESPGRDHPGPGAYDQGAAASPGGPSAKSFGFSRSPSRPNRAVSPGKAPPTVGPGSYELPSSLFNSAPGYTAQPRRESPAPKVPGPGAYDHGRDVSPGSPRYGFGSSPARPKATHSRVSRSPEAVGPGAYTVPCSFGTGPEFSWPARRESKPATVPGPGAYHAEPRSPSPRKSGCSFAGRPRLQEASPRADKDCLTGPGSYQAAQSTISSGSPAFSIMPRRESAPPEVPGPGSYNPPSAFAA